MRIFIFVLFTLVTTNAMATPMFYWDNQDKLVEATSCKIVKTQSNRFRFSNYFGKNIQVTENLRNYKNILQSHLINSSLVKIIDGAQKKDYKKIEVVAVNQMEDPRGNRWFSERGDKGYLFHHSLKPAEDFILNLTSGAPDVAFGNIRSSTIGTLWHIASEETYYKMVCGEFTSGREYIVFRVYSPEKKDGPIALVGVYWDETSIFRSYKALSNSKAYKIIPTILKSERIEDLSAGNINNFENFKASSYPAETLANVLAKEDATTATEIKEENQVVQGNFENIICISHDTLNVRNINLDKVLFNAAAGEKVKIFQGWDGETKKTKKVNGSTYNFIKVQFPEREEADETQGWVAESFVQPKSTCQYVSKKTYIRDHNFVIKSINDESCCEFPTVKRPTDPYTEAPRNFGSRRANGKRKHAACDLYRYKDEPVLSVAPGKIIVGKYHYYQGTYAIQVRHAGGFIAVYGEITGQNAKGVKQGAVIKMGQRLGHIGKVNSNCCRPMLHFELYSGSETGVLKRPGLNRFSRRSDLLDPTPYLLKWEDGKF